MATIDLLRNDPNVKTIAAGDTIFFEGDAGDSAFVVTEGEIDLSISGRHLECVSAGGIFGEMALIDHKTRSATATARTEAKVVPVDQRRFLYLLQNTPFFAIEVMQVMAQRLRRMDATV
ncbi:MAG: Crp/Fnr family transcriptional regulator [Vulcanimicrobiaceae bacterium]